MTVVRWLSASVLFLVLGCNDRAHNFSQYPGFAEWYAANPPASALPTPEQASLLKRYQPRVFLPDGHEGPIDFYRDYIANGELRDRNGELLSSAVDQTLLNANKADPSVVFTHRPSDGAPEPKIYGRIDERPVNWPGCSEALELTFLTYHLVFRSSGLPAGVPAWQAVGMGLIADLDDWHQLDHYTALIITLAPVEPGVPRPIAATFQQHNYQRTYLFGAAPGPGRLALPSDDRLEIDIAIRSNELYPHQPGRTSRRAVSFLDRKSAAYMIADGAAPWLAADDVTEPVLEIEPVLDFLPPDDAFYTFQGWLGERRRLPGRDGPPGADYNTLPPMKPLVNQLALSWWHEGDLDWLEHFEALFQDGRPKRIDPKPFLARVADAVDFSC
ncbi:MAG: hypothetical protein OEU92_02950 [Alphaproteobacteria bacterium]|nr:hypothetical protein [Alphaproteobacteria bacterium]